MYKLELNQQEGKTSIFLLNTRPISSQERDHDSIATSPSYTPTHTLSVWTSVHYQGHRDYVPFFQSVSSRSATTQTATGEHKHGEAPPHTSRSLTRSLINSPTCARSFSSEVHIAFLTGENCRAIKSSEEEHSSSWY